VTDTNKRVIKGTPPATAAPLQIVTSSLTLYNGSFHARLTGPSGSKAVVDASANLPSWMPFQTKTLPSGGLDVSVPLGSKQYRFLRERLPPSCAKLDFSV